MNYAIVLHKWAKKNRRKKWKTTSYESLFTNTKLLEANVFSQAVLYIYKIKHEKPEKRNANFHYKYTELYDLCIDSNILVFMVVK